MRALLLFVLFFTLACSPKGRDSSLSLKVQLGGIPVSLDPVKSEDGLSLRVLVNVMDGLLGYDSKGKLQNLLASSIETSPDQKRYSFTIRPDARWSDGRPIVAADFVLALKRALAPTALSKLAESLVVIKGAEDYRSGKSPQLTGVQDQDGKLVIELERPVSFFLQLMTLPVAMPARQDVLDAHSGRWAEGTEWTQTPTTGPYRIATFIQDQKIGLEPNPYYWGPRPRIEAVEWVIVSDESTGVNLFDQGKIDILTKIPTLQYKRWKSEGKSHSFPFLATYYLGFNCQKPPFNQPDFRRAVFSSIDRKEIVDALMTGEVPARTWIPPGLEGHISYQESLKDYEVGDTQNRFVRSVSKIKALSLSQSQISLQFDSSDRNSMIMEKVQQDLKKNLNLKVSLLNLDWKTHVKSVQVDAPPLFRLAWQTPFLDPIFHLQVLTSHHPANPTGCSNAEYDRLVKLIELEKPGHQRELMIHKAQKILLEEEAMIVPLYHYVQNYAVSSRVKNFRANPFGVIRLNELEVDDGSKK